jgi:hypothetical protein
MLNSGKLLREADVEMTLHIRKIRFTPITYQLRAKKGPRAIRRVHFPAMSSMLNLTRGKHRGHLPDPVEADKQALQAGRDIVLGMMGVTPEQMETRKAFARTPVGHGSALPISWKGQ